MHPNLTSDSLQGWDSYLADEPHSYHSLALTWELPTVVPSWLRGSYVKNGPAQKQFDQSRHYTGYLDSWGKLHK